MPKNAVQFQRGTRLSRFLAQYGTEARCERALFPWRWPHGFVCPEWAGTRQISAMALGRQLGVSYTSAWLTKHNLMQAMLEQEQDRKLTGIVQMDDANWGGRRRGYKRGHGTRDKTPLVAAVATDPLR